MRYDYRNNVYDWDYNMALYSKVCDVWSFFKPSSHISLSSATMIVRNNECINSFENFLAQVLQ